MTNVVKINWLKDTRYDVEEEILCFVDTNLPLNGIYEDVDGTIRYYKNGKYHNENGPAYIGRNGFKVYRINGKRHRIDGPAEIYSDEDYDWWINDYYIEKEIMNNWLTKNYIPLDWNVWSDSAKKKFANYWTEKYGSPYDNEDEEEPEPTKNKHYIIETKEETLVVTGDSDSILKQILQMKDFVSIKETKITNL